MAFNLDFLVIGVQKSATSWLYYCLKEHPEISLPTHKKEKEYIGGPLYKSQGGIEWFSKLFLGTSDSQVVGDVSVEYCFSNDAPATIAKQFPNCKLIMILRDPVDRFYSAINWYVRKKQIPQLSDKENLKCIQEQDALFHNDLLKRGCYYEQIMNYLKYFSSDQLLLIDFDGIKSDPNSVVRNIYNFLEVDEDFLPSNISNKPKQNSNQAILVTLESMLPKNRIISKVIDNLHQWLPKKQATKNNELNSYLIDYYSGKNERLVELIQSDIRNTNLVNSIKHHWAR